MLEVASKFVFDARSILARLTDDLEGDPEVRWIVEELDDTLAMLLLAQKALDTEDAKP